MTQKLTTEVCIVGAGPAGMMTALKLARYGVKVLLLERSPTFPAAREFRGESISQQSIGIFSDLGLMPALKKHNYLQTEHMHIIQDDELLLHVDFTTLPYEHRFPIDIPQPLMLGELLEKAQQYPSFSFIKGAKCIDLINDGNAIAGVRVQTGNGDLDVYARLVVGADGRYTKMREYAGIKATVKPIQRDVVWFKIPRPGNWGNVAKIMIKGGKNLIILPTYPDLLRVGLSIPSGGYRKWRESGLENFHSAVDEFDPNVGALVRAHITSFSETSLLDIFSAEVPQWYLPGFVLIGDAAHTFSPILGQGVNQGILDAAYLAPLVCKALREGSGPIDAGVLKTFQQQRQKQVDFIQRFQRRQEKMINSDHWFWRQLRTVFYRTINSLPGIKIAMGQRLYYNNKVAGYLRQTDSALSTQSTSL